MDIGDLPGGGDVLQRVAAVVAAATELEGAWRLGYLTAWLPAILAEADSTHRIPLASLIADSGIMGKAEARAFVGDCMKTGGGATIAATKAASNEAMGGNTWPYIVDGGRLALVSVRNGSTDAQPIAGFEARIVGQLVDEDGERYYTIAGSTVAGAVFDTEITASQYSDSGKLKAALETAAGPRDPVYAKMAEHLGPAIKLLSTGEIETRRLRHRTGWDGDRFLIPGRVPDDTEIRLDTRAFYGVAPGDLGRGIEALRALMCTLAPEKTSVLLSAVLGPVAARAMGVTENKYACFIRGVTGSHKTTTTRLFMALFGTGILDDSRLLGFGNKSTVNAIMHIAAQCGDLPLLVDNWKPNTTRNGDKDFYVLAHGILEGGDKIRMRQNASGLHAPRSISAWPIFTGEDLPSGDSATVARTLTILLTKKPHAEVPELDAAQALSDHLPTIGDAWISWLESEEGQECAAMLGHSLGDRRSYWLRYLIARRPEMANPHRVATNLAVNDLMFDLITLSPFGDWLTEYKSDHLRGLEQAALDAGTASGGGLEAHRFVEALRELLSTGRALLAASVNHHDRMVTADKDRMVGWAGEDGSAYIYPALALSMVTRTTGDDFNGLTLHAMMQQMLALDWLASHDTDRLTKSARVSGRKERYIHLAAAALEEPDPEDVDLSEFEEQLQDEGAAVPY